MNMHQNEKLTPAGRPLLVRRMLEEGQAPEEVGRAADVSRLGPDSSCEPREQASVDP